MDKKRIIEIAARIYGLYLLVQIPIALTGLFSVFSINHDQFVKNPILYKTWAIIHPIFYLIIALLLISKAEYISKLVIGKNNYKQKDIFDSSQSHTQLSFWITLLGLYFLINSLSSLVRDIIRHPLHWGDTFAWSILISQSLIFFASLYMIFRSRNIEAFILIKSKSRT